MTAARVVASACAALAVAGCLGPGPSPSGSRVVHLQPLSERQITLVRTACFGSCPDYTVTVDADGLVDLASGGTAVRQDAERKRIAPDDALGLFALADSLRFSALPPSIDEQCRSHVTDQPATIVSVRGAASEHRSSVQSCGTLAWALASMDSLVLNGRTVARKDVIGPGLSLDWEDDDALIRASYLRWVALGRTRDGSPEAVLRRDSLARDQIRRLRTPALAVDRATGADAWAAERSLWPR